LGRPGNSFFHFKNSKSNNETQVGDYIVASVTHQSIMFLLIHSL